MASLDTSLTGIPTDVLFGTIVALGGLVYRDLVKRVDGIVSEAKKRARIQNNMQSYQRLICDKLKIPYNGASEDDE